MAPPARLPQSVRRRLPRALLLRRRRFVRFFRVGLVPLAVHLPLFVQPLGPRALLLEVEATHELNYLNTAYLKPFFIHSS